LERKLKLVIVDDEYIIRNWLSMVISRHESLYEVIGTVASGDEAISICSCNTVDLLITDIRMSPMDGLELIKRIKKISSRTKFVIISNYEDFKYAKEALRLGASDYLLKAEIVEEDIIDCINRVKSEIDFEEKQSINLSDSLEANNEVLDYVRQSCLIKLINQPNSENDTAILNRLKSAGILLKNQDIFVIVFSFDKTLLKSDMESLHYEHYLLDAMKKNLSLWFEYGAAIKYDENKFIAIVNSTTNSLKTVREQLYVFTTKVITDTICSTGISVSAVISNSANSLSELPNQFKNASIALEKRFYTKGGSIVFYTEIQEKEVLLDKQIIRNKLYFLNNELTCWKYDNAIETAKSILGDIKKLNLPPDEAKQYSTMIIDPFILFARSVSKGASDEDPEFQHFDETISKFVLYTQIANFTLTIIDKAIKFICSAYNQDSIVEKTINYINNHFDQDITLASLAAHSHITASYLSKLFKEKTGENLVNYISKVRINFSKQSLKNSDLKISDIAIKAGYPNVSYFTQVFKRLEGIPPIEYRINQKNA